MWSYDQKPQNLFILKLLGVFGNDCTRNTKSYKYRKTAIPHLFQNLACRITSCISCPMGICKPTRQVKRSEIITEHVHRASFTCQLSYSTKRQFSHQECYDSIFRNSLVLNLVYCCIFQTNGFKMYTKP